MTWKVAGVDPSLTSTGVVVLGSDGFESMELVKSQKEGDKPIDETRRILDLSRRIVEAVDGCDLVCLENVAYSIRNTNCLAQLSALNYAIRFQLLDMGIEFVIVAATSLKKAITGSGRGDKNLVMMSSFQEFGKDIREDNLVDAHGLAKLAEWLKTDAAPKKHQKEVVALLKKQLKDA